jgi:hypothetical protein
MRLMAHFSYCSRLVTALLVLVGIFLSPIHAWPNANSRELNGKIADIALLMDQLEDRKQQATSVLDELGMLRDELFNEIRILNKNYGIAALDDVDGHPRVEFNIRLLQQLLAYTRALQDKIQLYQTGKDKLTYLHQLVQDDLRMSATLDHYAIDALTTQISMLINKYLPEAHVIQIDPQHLEQVSAQQIWNLVQR